MSETFIAAEMYRVEQAGIPLVSSSPAGRAYRHPVVERIAAPITYLPRTTSLSHDASLMRWLALNIPTFRRPSCSAPAKGRSAWRSRC